MGFILIGLLTAAAMAAGCCMPKMCKSFLSQISPERQRPIQRRKRKQPVKKTDNETQSTSKKAAPAKGKQQPARDNNRQVTHAPSTSSAVVPVVANYNAIEYYEEEEIEFEVHFYEEPPQPRFVDINTYNVTDIYVPDSDDSDDYAIAVTQQYQTYDYY